MIVSYLKNNFTATIAQLLTSPFFKNILVVMSGTAVAQIIGFALTPIISRLFSPSDFGVFGSFGSILGVIAAGVTLQYTQAIMLPKEKTDAINLFFISCLSAVFITLLCLAAILIVPAFFLNIMKTHSAWMLVLLVMAVFVSGLNQSFQAWCVRVKAFRHTSASQVIRTIAANGTQIGFGWFQGGALGLVCGAVLADIVASINLARVLFSDLKALRPDIQWVRMKQLAVEYRDFPIYSATQSVIGALSLGLPVLLLGYFYDIAVAGAYAFGVRILLAPMSFVLTALRQVLFQKASETYNYRGKLYPLYLKTTSVLLAMVIIPASILFIWSPSVFAWLFGSEWHEAGIYARWLVLWLVSVFINVPSILFGRILRLQSKLFFYDLLLLGLRIAIFVLGGIYLESLQTIVLFSTVSSWMNTMFVIWIGYVIYCREKRTSKG
ncbi:MAG: oligosaccharide flippase family protein [Sedimentisphaerales bacterium]